MADPIQLAAQLDALMRETRLTEEMVQQTLSHYRVSERASERVRESVGEPETDPGPGPGPSPGLPTPVSVSVSDPAPTPTPPATMPKIRAHLEELFPETAELLPTEELPFRPEVTERVDGTRLREPEPAVEPLPNLMAEITTDEVDLNRLTNDFAVKTTVEPKKNLPPPAPTPATVESQKTPSGLFKKIFGMNKPTKS